RMLRQTSGAMLRGTGIGFVAGVLPGAGASLGSFLAYMAEKSVAKDKASFGKGNPKGVAAPEAGNNAAAGGALVPMLALGVPGSGTTAVLLAVMPEKHSSVATTRATLSAVLLRPTAMPIDYFVLWQKPVCQQAETSRPARLAACPHL
ncbi:MAG: tripartite tricarboxylate transporter permease, partial [Fuerstiella sp.]